MSVGWGLTSYSAFRGCAQIIFMLFLLELNQWLDVKCVTFSDLLSFCWNRAAGPLFVSLCVFQVWMRQVNIVLFFSQYLDPAAGALCLLAAGLRAGWWLGLDFVEHGLKCASGKWLVWQTCKTSAPFLLCLFISAYDAVVILSLTTFSSVLWLTKETIGF